MVHCFIGLLRLGMLDFKTGHINVLGCHSEINSVHLQCVYCINTSLKVLSLKIFLFLNLVTYVI